MRCPNRGRTEAVVRARPSPVYVSLQCAISLHYLFYLHKCKLAPAPIITCSLLGGTLTIDVCTSDFDTQLWVGDACPSPSGFGCLAGMANDNTPGCGINNWGSRVAFPATSRLIYIVVGGALPTSANSYVVHWTYSAASTSGTTTLSSSPSLTVPLPSSPPATGSGTASASASLNSTGSATVSAATSLSCTATAAHSATRTVSRTSTMSRTATRSPSSSHTAPRTATASRSVTRSRSKKPATLTPTKKPKLANVV